MMQIQDVVRLAVGSLAGFMSSLFNFIIAFKWVDIAFWDQLISAILGFLTGIATLIFLCYQIKKIRRDLKNPKPKKP